MNDQNNDWPRAYNATLDAINASPDPKGHAEMLVRARSNQPDATPYNAGALDAAKAYLKGLDFSLAPDQPTE